MQIKITPRTLGGTEFTAQPARLHLGAQNAEGVDRLVFQLPAEWAGCSVTLHIRHSDGTLAAPLVLDAAHSAPVGRSFTGWPAGQWMLAATDGSGYTAYTRPGRYDVYDILPTDGSVGAYKTDWLDELEADGATIDLAYGNATTDIHGYKDAGILAARQLLDQIEEGQPPRATIAPCQPL